VIHFIPLTIESMVSILLRLTILYCVRLNTQLTRLKSEGATMQATIAELLAATENAECAVAALKTTVREADATLGERLKDAERFSEDMQRNTAAGAEVLKRLVQIAGARLTEAEPEEEPMPARPDPRSIVAAAQALAERARARLAAA
jgi:hypothetical protein